MYHRHSKILFQIDTNLLIKTLLQIVKHEKNVNEILLRNYRHWIATTKNEEHKAYATRMLAATYDGNQGQVFKEYGDKAHKSKKIN